MRQCIEAVESVIQQSNESNGKQECHLRRPSRRADRLPGLMAALVGASLLVLAPKAQAQGANNSLAARLAALETRVSNLETTVRSQASTIATLQSAVNTQATLLNGVLGVFSFNTAGDIVLGRADRFVSILGPLTVVSGGAIINGPTTINGFTALLSGLSVTGESLFNNQVTVVGSVGITRNLGVGGAITYNLANPPSTTLGTPN
jgi:hypothetical protein